MTDRNMTANEKIIAWLRQVRRDLLDLPHAPWDDDDEANFEAVLARLSPEPKAKPRDLQSLCDRLNEMFNLDDTPDELSQEAREAIEELWASRDCWMNWAAHLQSCTDCHLDDNCAEGLRLRAAVSPEAQQGPLCADQPRETTTERAAEQLPQDEPPRARMRLEAAHQERHPRAS